MFTDSLENKEILKSVLETAVDGVILINEKGIVQSLNKSALELFGYEEGELNGENVSILMPEPHQSSHDQYISNYLNTGERKIIGIGREVEGKRKDGSYFPFNLSVSEILLKNGRIFTGIVHDISELKKAELKLKSLNEKLEMKVIERTEELSGLIKQLKQTNNALETEIEAKEKAQHELSGAKNELEQLLVKERELNDLKSKFVTLASHEFKTPLSAILSSAQLISKYTSDQNQDKRQKHIDRIQSSVHNLNNVLNDFLSLGRIEEGRVQYQPSTFNFVDLVKDLKVEMEEIKKPGQILTCNCNDEKILVSLDKNLCRNILTNLVSNAIKYSGENGEILLSLKSMGQNLSLVVKDEGRGIPENELKHIFDRFYRATNAVNIKGTGLGLNITRSYVQMMSGAIELESLESEGTTVTVILPRNISNG